MRARGFEQVERAVGIDAEIGKRFAGCPVVAWLGGGVDDEFDVRAVFFKDVKNGFLVSNVHVLRGEIREIGGQFRRRRKGRSVRSEEILALIVVNADDFVEFLRKIFDRL